VATDVRLWLRSEMDLIIDLLVDLQKSLVEVAEKNVEVILPGFTHLQVAQPVSFAHHLLAYVEMFARDAERMSDVRRRTNRLPLGSAALAGTTYPLDRERVARTLGMVDEHGNAQVCQNSLDGVSDRDFAIEFTAAASLCMVHISRMSEELILWMSQNFGFIKIADHHAAEEKPRRARTRTRQNWACSRPLDGAHHLDERPAPGLQQRQPRRQRAFV
jgi:argininosuccinate lyase